MSYSMRPPNQPEKANKQHIMSKGKLSVPFRPPIALQPMNFGSSKEIENIPPEPNCKMHVTYLTLCVLYESTAIKG